MHTSLNELPVLLFMLRGGLIAGAGCFLIRLPGRLYRARLAGRRAKAWAVLLFWLLDFLAAGLLFGLLALTLIEANGGVPRLFALLGFFGAALASSGALRLLLWGGEQNRFRC